MDVLSEKIKNLSPEKKASLKKLIQKKALDKAKQEGNNIPRRSEEGGHYPLSSAQQRLWFLAQFSGSQDVFKIHSAVKLHISINADLLKKSVELIVDRHESLRTLFKKVEGEPRQYVTDKKTFYFNHHDLAHLNTKDAIDEEIRRVDGAQRKSLFSLEDGPLLKVTLLNFSSSFNVMILTIHHIASDGLSISILMRELFEGYAALEKGQALVREPIEVQYIDYACWQQGRLNGVVMQDQWQYWSKILEGAPQILDMPTDYARPKTLNYQGRAHNFQISAERLNQLKLKSKEWGCSVFMLGLTAYNIVLSRYCNQTDMLIGTDVANRNNLQITPLIGFFINQLVLRCQWVGDPTLQELSYSIRQTCLQAYANQDVPFNQLVEKFVSDRDQSRTPLFQAKFVIDNSDGAVSTPNQITAIASETEAVEFDLEVAFKELDGVLEGCIRYRSELFSPASIETFAEYYQVALTAILEQPGLRLSELSLLTSSEQQRIQVSNQTDADTPGTVLVDALLACCEAENMSIAVEDSSGARSYLELRRDVEQMAAYFISQGIVPGSTVAVCVARNVNLLVVHLAILRVGACYVPIDLEYGKKRIDYILEDSVASVLIVTEANAGLFLSETYTQLVLPSDWRESWSAELPSQWPSVSSSQLAYIIYTSGSTGRPKGVAISLASLSNFLHSMKTLIGMSPNDSLLSVTTVSFDIAGLELYLPLLCNARLFIADQQQAQDSRLLLEILEQESISVMQATPATWSALCEVAGDRVLPSLCALSGGEALPQSLATRLLSMTSRLINLYGPTETTIWSSGVQITKESLKGLPYAPLGHAIANTQLYVLDADGNQQLTGAVGELCIAGDGLAQGYQGRAALTAEAFVPNPFTSVSGSRLYRTGDCVKRLSDNTLVYFGRNDHQVKVRGYRIELGEIETVFKRHQDVEMAVVVAKQDSTGFNVLYAFVRLTTECIERECIVESEPDTLQRVHESILTEAAQYLLNYMLPSVVQILSTFPRTANGKVDRKALIGIAKNTTDVQTTVKTLPQSALECQLADLWRHTLSLEDVFLEQDFFRSGGHSLLAIQLLDRIEKATNRRISLVDFFTQPTLSGLVAQTTQNANAVQSYPQIKLDQANKYQPFPLTDLQQAYLIGRQDDLNLGSIATQNYFELNILNLDVAHFTHCWNKIVERHDMLRAVFDDQGMQRILPSLGSYAPHVSDFSEIAKPEKTAHLLALRGKMSQERMPEKTGPLFAIEISRLSDTQFRIHICLDMLISDVLSNLIIFGELDQLYRNPSASMPSFELSFRDYVLAEQSLKQSDLYKKAKNYWLERLDDFPNAPELPLVKGMENLSQQRFERRKHHIQSEQWGLIKQNAQALNVSPTVLLLCAYSQVLATWSSSKRFSLNLTLFNRLPLHQEVHHVVGDFTSSLLLEVGVDGNQSFAQQAVIIGKQLWRDLDNRLFSGVSVIRQLNTLSGGTQQSNMPIVFTSMLGMDSALDGQENEADQVVEIPEGGEDSEQNYSVSQTSQVWLDHQVAEEDGGLTLVWDAIDSLFPSNMLNEMYSAYCELVESLVEPQSWSEPPQLCPEPHLDFRNEPFDSSCESNPTLLHQLFLSAVAEQRDTVAVIAGHTQISYSQLDLWSRNLAALLIDKGAAKNKLVAIVMDKSWEQVVAAMAIIRAGAAYLPISSELPDRRVAELLSSGECELVLLQADTQLTERASAWADLHDSLTGLISIAISTSSLGALPDKEINIEIESTDIAYVIFTSGSTGKPKGVVIDHRGAVNTVIDINQRFNVTQKDRVLAISSLSFDLSVYDIFGLLAVGGALVIPVGDERHTAKQWFDLLVEHRITVWNSVPALMQLLVEHSESSSSALAQLRLVMMSGDWIPVDLPDRIKLLSSSCNVVSLGGATEASIWSIFHEIKGPTRHLTSIPYGKPLGNQQFYVLDGAGVDCPNWVRGELFIGGIGVAKGYWQDAERTSHSFIEHKKYGVIYRTGDLGRYDDHGVIEFMGREDSQVKVQGYRVELGEIEAILSQHPEINTSIVIAQGDRLSKTLVAYIVPKSGNKQEIADLVITDPLARSLFKLEQRGVRQLPARLPRLKLSAPSRLGGDAANVSKRFSTMFEPDTLISTLGIILGGLRQDQIESSPLPKYFYPSASSLYAVQLYLQIPHKFDGDDSVENTLYYFSAVECALVKLGAVPSDVSKSGNRAEQSDLPILYWVADMDAINPMYPEDEVWRFIHLEVGYMLAIIRQQFTTLVDQSVGGIDLQWVSDCNALNQGLPDAELTQAGLTILPKSAKCLAIGQLQERPQASTQGTADIHSTCADVAPVNAPVKGAHQLIKHLFESSARLNLSANLGRDNDSSATHYDILKRQSIRRFSNKSISVSSLAELLKSCKDLMRAQLEVLVFFKPGFCDPCDGLYRYDAQNHALIKSSLEIKEIELEQIYSGDNQAIFGGCAFAIYILGHDGNSADAQSAQLATIGEVSQVLMSRSWRLNIGLCPIGQVDTQLLSGLLNTESKTNNNLVMQHGFLGGVILPEQLEVWEPEGASTNNVGLDFSEQTAALKSFLREQLPAYMVPEVYIPLNKIPLSGNGKVDRSALPTADLEQQDLRSTDAAAGSPSNALEVLLQRLWQDLFSLPRVSVKQNFFHLGGNSLLAMRMTATLLNEHGIEVSLRDVFEQPSISGLASVITNAESENKEKLNIYMLSTESSRSRNKAESYPLTLGQQHLFAHHQTQDVKSAYNITTALRIRGQFDPQRLRITLQTLLDRHDALRTRFSYHGGEVCQTVDSEQRIYFEQIDLADSSITHAESEVKGWLKRAASHEFDMFKGPMLRCQLIRLLEDHHVLILNVHHIIADYLSMDLIAKEMAFLYGREGESSGVPLASLGLQFSDFVLWQQAFLKSDAARQQSQYWLKMLSGLPPLNFPNESSERPHDQQDGWLAYQCSAPTFESIEACSAEHGVTGFIIGLAALHQLLQYKTGQHDIGIGTPISNRFNHDLEGVVGLMLNTLVLRIKSFDDLTCGEFLAYVKEQVVDAFDNKDLPVEYIERELNKSVVFEQRPKSLYRVRYVYRNIDLRTEAPQPELDIEALENERSQAKFDLLVTVNKSDHSLSGEFEYRQSSLDQDAAKVMQHLYVKILHYMSENSGKTLSDLHQDLKQIEADFQTQKLAQLKQQKSRKLNKVTRRKRRDVPTD